MPPYLRLVEPSACWNASKMICCFSGALPIPVSLTVKASTDLAELSRWFSRFQPSVAGATSRATSR